MCTSKTPRLLSMSAIVVSWAKYIQRLRFDDNVDWVLLENRLKISRNKNPDRNFFISVVGVKILNHSNARFSNTLGGLITFSAHGDNLKIRTSKSFNSDQVSNVCRQYLKFFNFSMKSVSYRLVISVNVRSFNPDFCSTYLMSDLYSLNNSVYAVVFSYSIIR